MTETVKLTELKRHPRYHSETTPDQVIHLMKQIKQHGVLRPLIIASDGTILIGYATVEAAEAAGLSEIPATRMGYGPDSPEAAQLVADVDAPQAKVDTRKLTELLREVGQSGDFAEADPDDRERKMNDALLGTGYDVNSLTELVVASRMKDEIADKNAAREWLGLPAFDEQPRFRIMVSCETEAHREEVLTKLGRPTIRTRQHGVFSLWYPDRPREDLSSLRFVFDDDGNAEIEVPE